MGSPPVTAVFDTNIVIDCLRGLEQADEEYSRYDKVFISRVTWMEVLVGVDSEDVRDFLKQKFTTTAIDVEVAEAAIEIRRIHRRLKLPDAVIWATATTRDCVLVTRNTRDFPDEEKTVRVPYTI